MTVLTGLVAALVPGLLLLWYFLERDRFPEPTTGKKPVGGKFICTPKGRISCRK